MLRTESQSEMIKTFQDTKSHKEMWREANSVINQKHNYIRDILLGRKIGLVRRPSIHGTNESILEDL